MQQFTKRRSASVRNQKADEIVDMLDQNIRQDLSQTIAANITSGASSGIGLTSYQDLAMLSANPASISDSMASALINDLENSAMVTQKALNTLTTSLQQNYQSAINYAIDQVATQKSSLNSHEILQSLLTAKGRVISIDQTAGFTQEEQSLIQSYAKIQMAINLIPSLGGAKTSNLSFSTRSGKSGSVQSTSHLITLLLGKIGGNLTYLNSKCVAVASARAREVGEQKLDKELKKINKKSSNIASGKNISVTCNVEGEISDYSDAKKKAFINHKGAYSQLRLTDNGMVLSYEGNIKEIPKKKAKFGQSDGLNIDYETTLIKLLDQTKVDKYYIETIATAHGDSLQAAWRSLVDYAVAIGLIDRIKILAAGGTNKYMVSNDRLIKFSALISQLINNPDMITYTGGKRRYNYRNLNMWRGKEGVRNAFLARRRSRQLERDVQSSFYRTMVRTKLNMKLLGI